MQQTKKCYKYDGKGHFAVLCPTCDQKVALTCENHSNAIEGQQETYLEEGVEEVFVEEVLEGCKLTIYVIRQVLTTQQ